jgi:hypothetical protein
MRILRASLLAAFYLMPELMIKQPLYLGIMLS